MEFGKKKPKCKLIGENRNAFYLIALASRTLKKEKMFNEAKELQDRCFKAKNYDNLLNIIMEYVDVE